jgi:hypothetical protein
MHGEEVAATAPELWRGWAIARRSGVFVKRAGGGMVCRVWSMVRWRCFR